jgi:hypothetical protein
MELFQIKLQGNPVVATQFLCRNVCFSFLFNDVVFWVVREIEECVDLDKKQSGHDCRRGERTEYLRFFIPESTTFQ